MATSPPISPVASIAAPCDLFVGINKEVGKAIDRIFGGDLASRNDCFTAELGIAGFELFEHVFEPTPRGRQVPMPRTAARRTASSSP